jgi:hypothetical protein
MLPFFGEKNLLMEKKKRKKKRKKKKKNIVPQRSGPIFCRDGIRLAGF